MALSFIGSVAAGPPPTTGNGLEPCSLSIAGLSPQANDLIVVFSGQANGNATDPVGGGRPTNGAGTSYTVVVEGSKAPTIPTAYARLTVSYRFWADANDSTINVPAYADGYTSVQAVAFVIRGASTANPIDVAATIINGNSTNPNPPAITPANNNCLILAGANSLVDDSTPGTVTSYTSPANNTWHFSVIIIGTYKQTIASVYRQFRSIEEFLEELKLLKGAPEEAAP